MPTEFEMEFFLQENKKKVIFLKIVAIELLTFIIKKIKIFITTVMEIFGHGLVVTTFHIKVLRHLEIN